MMPLVGREAQLRHMVGLLGRATVGRPAVLVVTGPPGSGRNRLLREFAAAGTRQGAVVLTDAARSGRVVLLRHPSGAVNPLDLDNLDTLAACVPLLVVTTEHRPPAVFATTSAEIHHIRLAPLSAGDVHRLIAGLLGARPGDRLLDLARVAAGRPGAIGDLIAGLREEDLLRITADGAALVSVRLPARTRARLVHQLMTVSPSARHLVQAATTLPGRFPLASLGRLLRCGPLALLPDIEEVLDSGLLVDAGDLLSFSHELVRPIVQATMPRVVAAALAAQPARDRPKDAARDQPGRTPVGRAGHGRDQQAGGRRPGDWNLLSDREREIAGLVGQALTNRQIANRVNRSPHTVNYHLRQIFRKLGVASRVELVSLLRHIETLTPAPDQGAAAAARGR